MSEEGKKKGGKISGFLKKAFKAAVWGGGMFFLGGLADFALFHNNAGGEALVKATNSLFQGAYDFFGITDISFSIAEFFNGLAGGPDPVSYGQNLLGAQGAMFPGR